jgi:hypothetical protein
MSLYLPEREVAFVHVPRTAGTSMRSLLAWVPMQHYHHKTASAMDIPDNWYSFGFVRNPWARQLSYWRFYEHLTFDDYLSDCLSAWSYLSPGVTFIGRYENLQEDWRHVAEELDLPQELPMAHVDLEPITDYHPYYSDAQAAVVAERCKDDIEKFGYTF